jgi:oxygen-independent coproporphyrinogen III oxidase
VYCDFAIAVRSRVPVDEYVSALRCELERHPEELGPLETLYLGGGTPSRLGSDGIARVMDVVCAHTTITPGAEVTIEANPEDLTPEAVRGWRRAGINRLSLGVQSFDDGALAWMHRTHDAATSRRAVRDAFEAGLTNISVDLIFALPSALNRSWERDIDEALALDLPHLSVYGLTVEPRTPLGRWVARHSVDELPEEDFASEFLQAHRRLTAAGLDHYEVSNYGRPGRHSRHNWAYWQRRPYVGLGPSAHGFDGVARRWNTAAYTHWVDVLAHDGEPAAGLERLTPDDIAAEEVYLGMRTTEGVVLTNPEVGFVQRWIDAGWAELHGPDRLRLTANGWLRLDSLATSLTAIRSPSYI